MRNPLAERVINIPPSGIRKFFDVVNEMDDAISLGVGEPVRAAALTAKVFATGVVENCTLVGSAAADRVVKANQLAVLQNVTVQEASA